MKKATKTTSTLVRFENDPNVMAYAFINAWKDKEGKPITDKHDNQIKSASQILTGGAWKEGYSLAQLNQDTDDDELVWFINSVVMVWRIATKKHNKSKGTLAQ